jgi:hypothetical protein
LFLSTDAKGVALLVTITNVVLSISAQKPQAGDDDSALSPESVKVEYK